MGSRHRHNNGSISSRDSQKSKASNDSGIVLDLDPDFVPVKVHVYKNGDMFDVGTEIVVTRREFKHWFGFLDFVSKRIKSLKTITKLHSFNGEEIEGFDELKNNGQYVACYDAFKKIDYGKAKPLKWRPVTRQMNYHDPYGIDSHESLEIHLKKLGFESETGTSFPDDNPANHNRGKNHPRRIIAPMNRRGSTMVHDKKHHDDAEKTSLSLPKIGTSNNLTTSDPYEYNDRRGHRSGSDPANYSSRRRSHRSQSQNRRRNSYRTTEDRRRNDDSYYSDDYDRRRRHRSNRELSKRDYTNDDKYYKSDEKYYNEDQKYDDRYYKEDQRYDDKYYRDEKYYKNDDYDDYYSDKNRRKSRKNDYPDDERYSNEKVHDYDRE